MPFDNEQILQQIIGYSIGATTMVPQFSQKAKKTYSIALLPDGPHFYTGILQSAGCLLLNKKNKKLIIIDTQNQSPGKIQIYDGTQETVLGYAFLPITAIKKHIPVKQYQSLTKMPEAIIEKIQYIRTITATTHLTYMSFSSQIPLSKVAKILEKLYKGIGGVNYLFISNLHQKLSYEKSKKYDQNILSDILNQKFDQEKYEAFTTLGIYTNLVKELKKMPDIIAYINSSDFNGNKKQANGYACILA